MTEDTITAEEIAQNYSAALDSVNLANELFALETLTAGETDRLERNVKHLEIMVAKDYWTTEDLEPFNEVINQYKSSN